MLSQKFDPECSFCVRYSLMVASQESDEIVLFPNSFLSKDLVQLTLDLKDEFVVRARLKVSRALLAHPKFEAEVQVMLDAFIEGLFPDSCRDDFQSWLGQTNPSWCVTSDKLEVADYSLASRISQNWLQVEGTTKLSGKDGSWWRRITGR